MIGACQAVLATIGPMRLAHLGPDGVPLPFTWRELWENWYVEPGLTVGILWAIIVYLVCWQRGRPGPGEPLQRWRPWAFTGGLVLLILTVEGPFDRYGDVSAGIHMAQHMVLLYLVAPVLVAAAPLTVVARGLPAGFRRRWIDPVARSRIVQVLADPWVVAAVYVAAIVATHFTGWYDAALRDVKIHQAEHVAYLAAGFVWWTVLLGRDGRPVRRSAPRRLLVVLALEPVMTVIAIVFVIAPDPLYRGYVALRAPWGGREATLASQQVAGAIMWVPSTLSTMALLVALTVSWYRADEAARERLAVPGGDAQPSAVIVGNGRAASSS